MFKSAVVIPTYKEELNELEKISLAQVRKVLKNYPIIFVAPEGKNFSYLEPGEMLVQFHPQYFQSGKTYSQLLMSPFFYETFLSFDYILLYQLDAFVFYDALEDFCRLGWDYIGAPVAYHSWYGYKRNKVPRVGNGGFSLRKVAACHKLLTETSRWPTWNDTLASISEDCFFALCGVNKDLDFQTAPVEVAVCFAVDYFPDRFLRRIGNAIPFGCHGWSKCSADAYVKLFAQAGYDLRPLRDKMDTQDYSYALELSLNIVALTRLFRELERGKSLIQYLPTRNFASIRVIKSSGAMKILAQLLTEENFLADKIFIYDEKDFFDLIRDVERETLPHLMIVADYDGALVKGIENKGLVYGRHIVSFQREYMKAQEKLFHNLGR